RGGRPVPPSHRLDGGAMMLALRFEASAAAHLSAIFRAIWRAPAPISLTLASRFIDTLPVDGGSEHLVDYFTRRPPASPNGVGPALSRSVAAFESEGVGGLPGLGGARGLGVRFLHCTSPGQSVLAGTSSLRVEALARFLGEAGAESFFREVDGG